MIGLFFVRQEYNLSLQDIANKLSVSNQIVSIWEKNKKPIPQARLIELSKLFNIPAEYFQKELTETEKLNIQINKLNQHIDETTFKYDDQLYDETTGETVTVEREHFDQNALEFLDSLKVDKKELQLIDRLRTSINIIAGGFNITEETDLRSYTNSREENIKIYDRFIDIVNANNISRKLLCEIIRAIELTDENLSAQNGIFGEENPFDVTSVSDEKQIVQDLFAVLNRYLNDEKVIQQKNIQEAKEIQLLFANTDDSEDLY